MPALAVGSPVRFRLGDIFCLPGDEALLQTILEILDAEWPGRVLFFSSPMPGMGQYAAVEVDGLGKRFILPVDRLTHSSAPAPGSLRERAAAGWPDEEAASAACCCSNSAGPDCVHAADRREENRA